MHVAAAPRRRGTTLRCFLSVQRTVTMTPPHLSIQPTGPQRAFKPSQLTIGYDH